MQDRDYCINYKCTLNCQRKLKNKATYEQISSCQVILRKVNSIEECNLYLAVEK